MLCTPVSRSNVSDLRRFCTATQQHDYLAVPRGEIHPPARAEMLANFRDAVAHRLNVTEIAEGGLTKPNHQAPLYGLVRKAFEPSVELRQRADGVHAGIVIDRLHLWQQKCPTAP